MNSFICSPHRGTVYKNQILFPSAEDNRLVSVDVRTGQVVFGAELMHIANSREAYSDYSAAIDIGRGELLFIPRHREKILMLHMDGQKQSFLDFRLPGILGETAVRYWAYSIHRDSLFLFPFQADHIVQISLGTKSIKIHRGISEEAERFAGRKAESYFAAESRYHGSSVLLACWSENAVAELDLDTMAVRMSALENEAGEKGFLDIAVFGGYLYAVNHRFHVFAYELGSFRPAGQIPLDMGCSMIRQTEPGLCLLSAFGGGRAILDCHRHVTLSEDCQEESRSPQSDLLNYNRYLAESDDDYYVMCIHTDKLISVGKKTGAVRSVSLKYDKSVMEYLCTRRELLLESGTGRNGLRLSAEGFVDGVCGHGTKAGSAGRDSVGRGIYGAMADFICSRA